MIVPALSKGDRMSETVERRASASLGTAHFREANERVRACLESADVLELHDVYAQRYLGSAMPAGKRIEIFGTPGNDMASYLDGGEIEVFGNAQDQIGNTMNAGMIAVHGRCGDAAGYAMRGGRIFIRDGCGWRVGIHMKQYEDRCPAIVIGGDAGSFLGEYMAGGIIVLLGHPGKYLATGMHGGVIYLRHRLEDEDVMDGLVQKRADAEDVRVIDGLLGQYGALFGSESAERRPLSGDGFWKIVPVSNRPYAALYSH